MFDFISTWSNKTLFAWYDASNATHVLVFGIIGSIVSTALFPLIASPFLKGWKYAKSVAIDESRKTPRYLRALEQRARIHTYWNSASAAQRIHFVAIRIAIIISGSVTFIACQGYFVLGTILQTLQQDIPSNTVAIFNAAQQATTSGVLGVAAYEQQYIVPSMVLLCFEAVTVFGFTISAVMGLLYRVRLAELEHRPVLIEHINAIRTSLDLPQLSDDSPILNPPNSFLYPL